MREPRTDGDSRRIRTVVFVIAFLVYTALSMLYVGASGIACRAVGVRTIELGLFMGPTLLRVNVWGCVYSLHATL